MKHEQYRNSHSCLCGILHDFLGAKMETSGSNIAIGVGMYVTFKIAPVAIGIMFAFNIYLHFMGVML